MSCAQYNLGVLYLNGQGVRQDFTQAAQWSRKAADQGFAPAEYNLAALYDNGHGVKQSNVEALHWYREAAVGGVADAMIRLGEIYKNGELGEPRDLKLSRQWYDKAQERRAGK